MPAPDGGDDFIGVFGPGKGFGALVVLGQEAFNGPLQLDDAFEDATLETAFGENGKEAFDGIQPGRRCWREVEDETRMPGQPFDDLWVLVSRIVVEDHMNDFADRNFGFNDI